VDELDNHKANFAKTGYTIFPAVYDIHSLAAWREIGELHRQDRKFWIVGGLIEVHPTLALSVITNPTILSFVEKLIGPFVQLDGMSLVGSRSSIDTGKELDWHRDPWGSIPSSGGYEPPRAVNAIVYLQDLTDNVGPLRVLPGSHRMPLTMSAAERRLPHPDERLLSLRAGDVVVLHNNLVHSRTPGDAGISRFHLSVLYNHSWLKSTFNFGGPVVQSVLAYADRKNDHRLLRIFGEDRQIVERGNCAFLVDEESCWQTWLKEDSNALLSDTSPG